MRKSIKHSLIISIILLITITILTYFSYLNFLNVQICDENLYLGMEELKESSELCKNPPITALFYGLKLGLFYSVISFIILIFGLKFMYKKKGIEN